MAWSVNAVASMLRRWGKRTGCHDRPRAGRNRLLKSPPLRYNLRDRKSPGASSAHPAGRKELIKDAAKFDQK